MLDKEKVIHRIGEENWESFDLFMMGRDIEFDEDGFEVYYIGDVVDYENILKSISKKFD